MAKAPDILSVATSLYKLLKPLDSEARVRAIKSTLMMLGDAEVNLGEGKSKSGQGDGDGGGSTLPKVKAWMKAHGVSQEQIDHVFHIEGEVADILATDVPGKSGKDKTVNAYVLTGIGEFLRTGEPKFDDKAARAACDKLGCYQATNHATFMKSPGKVLTGTKGKGWTVTGPGLKAGAELIKGLGTE